LRVAEYIAQPTPLGAAQRIGFVWATIGVVQWLLGRRRVYRVDAAIGNACLRPTRKGGYSRRSVWLWFPTSLAHTSAGADATSARANARMVGRCLLIVGPSLPTVRLPLYAPNPAGRCHAVTPLLTPSHLGDGTKSPIPAHIFVGDHAER
jgi:hypothetical protein